MSTKFTKGIEHLRFPFIPTKGGEVEVAIKKALSLVDKSETEKLKSIKFVRDISLEKGFEYDNTYVELSI